LALRAILFKFHNQLKQHPTCFQSVTLEITQNDEDFYTYRRSVKLCSIISASLNDARGLLLSTRTANEPMRFSIKARGSRSTYLSASMTFNTSITVYKKQWDPNQRIPLLLLLSARASPCTKERASQSIYPSTCTAFSMCITAYKKQGVPDQHTSLLLLLSARASPHIKSKGFPINVPLCFYYFQHKHHCVQKARGARSILHTSSTTFHMHLLSRIKSKGLHSTHWSARNQVSKRWSSIMIGPTGPDRCISFIS
jgi:hypothetical protein